MLPTIINNQFINNLALLFVTIIKKLFVLMAINAILYYSLYIYYKIKNKNNINITNYKNQKLKQFIDITGKILILSIVLIVTYTISYYILKINGKL